LLAAYFADNILLNEMDPVDLLRENVTPCPASEFKLGDYTHIEPSLTVRCVTCAVAGEAVVHQPPVKRQQ